MCAQSRQSDSLLHILRLPFPCGPEAEQCSGGAEAGVVQGQGSGQGCEQVAGVADDHVGGGEILHAEAEHAREGRAGAYPGAGGGGDVLRRDRGDIGSHRDGEKRLRLGVGLAQEHDEDAHDDRMHRRRQQVLLSGRWDFRHRAGPHPAHEKRNLHRNAEQEQFQGHQEINARTFGGEQHIVHWPEHDRKPGESDGGAEQAGFFMQADGKDGGEQRPADQDHPRQRNRQWPARLLHDRARHAALGGNMQYAPEPHRQADADHARQREDHPLTNEVRRGKLDRHGSGGVKCHKVGGLLIERPG